MNRIYQYYEKAPFLLIGIAFLVIFMSAFININSNIETYFNFNGFISSNLIEFPGDAADNLGLPATQGNTSGSVNADTDLPFLDNLVLRLFSIVKIIFEGVAILFIVYFGIRMMLAGGESTEIAKFASGMLDAILGFLLINAVGIIVNVFDPAQVGTDLVNVPEYEILFLATTKFIQYSAGIVAFVMFFIAGYKLVLPGSKGSETGKSSLNQILYGIAGLFIILIAEAVQDAIIAPRLGEGGTISPGDSTIDPNLVQNIFGIFETILRVILYFFMPIAVILVIYAGAQLIFKGFSENTWSSSLTILRNVFIALIILLSSYTIVSEVLKFA